MIASDHRFPNKRRTYTYISPTHSCMCYYTEKRDHEIFWNSRNFYHGRLNIGQNPRSYESFIPRNFGAIRYITCIIGNKSITRRQHVF